jgi:hypothetical protein
MPDYDAKHELTRKRLDTGFVDMERQISRKKIVRDGPLHTIDCQAEPQNESRRGKRRCDMTLVFMEKTTPRDNTMYRLTDTYNLDRNREVDEQSWAE